MYVCVCIYIYTHTVYILYYTHKCALFVSPTHTLPSITGRWTGYWQVDGQPHAQQS